LSALEIEDLVTVRDAVAVTQRLEMVRRIASEIEDYVVELGTDGRLLSLQLEELMAGVEQERELIVRDYMPPPTGRRPRKFEDVQAVEGVGETRARSVREGLSRLAESSILRRYV